MTLWQHVPSDKFKTYTPLLHGNLARDNNRLHLSILIDSVVITHFIQSQPSRKPAYTLAEDNGLRVFFSSESLRAMGGYACIFVGHFPP